MLSTIATLSFQDVSGSPYSSGRLIIYAAGTQTGSTMTFADAAMTLPKYDFTLDARGCAQVYATEGAAEDLYLYDRNGAFIKAWYSYPLTSVIQEYVDQRDQAVLAQATLMVNNESTRATEEEESLSDRINDEVTRATGVESGLRTDVDAKLSTVSVDGTTVTGDGTASNPLVAHSSANALIHAGGGTNSAWVGSNVSGFYSGMGTNAFEEGYNTRAFGEDSHAEGKQTLASALGAHAEGVSCEAGGAGAHAEGGTTRANGVYAHTEGFQCVASLNYSHAEGYMTCTADVGQHVSGIRNDNSTHGAEVVGIGSTTSSTLKNGRVLDWNGKESTRGIGSLNTNLGSYNPTFQGETYLDTSTGKMYYATGTSSPSDWQEIGGTVTTDATLTGDGSSSSPLGVARMTNGSGANAVQFGYGGTANGDYSIAAGNNCTATGNQSFVTGTQNTTTSTGANSIVCGSSNSCAGGSSIVSGYNNEVSANNGNAIIGGRYNVNSRANQVVLGGTYNVSTSGAVIVSGIGDSTTRKNGFELMNTGCVKSRGIDSLNTDLGSTTPTFVGQTYRDTTTNHIYVATDTSSSSDWVDLMGSSNGLSGVYHDSTLSGSGTSASPLSAEPVLDELSAGSAAMVDRGGVIMCETNTLDTIADSTLVTNTFAESSDTQYVVFTPTSTMNVSYWQPHFYCTSGGTLEYGLCSNNTPTTILGTLTLPTSAANYPKLAVNSTLGNGIGVYIKYNTATGTVYHYGNSSVSGYTCYKKDYGSSLASIEPLSGVFYDVILHGTAANKMVGMSYGTYAPYSDGTTDYTGKLYLDTSSGTLYVGVGTTWVALN